MHIKREKFQNHTIAGIPTTVELAFDQVKKDIPI
jgi:hypothetical protein